MCERRDDTTETAGTPPCDERGGRAPGSYYYDDATGYELYEPDEEEAGETQADEDEEQA